VAVLVTVTLAPEITAPLLSRTTPLIEPDSTCANTVLAMPNPKAKIAAAKKTTRAVERIFIESLPWTQD
jgi:hypothetical protein